MFQKKKKGGKIIFPPSPNAIIFCNNLCLLPEKILFYMYNLYGNYSAPPGHE